MEVMYPRCCGLDIHKKMVMACVITPDAKGQARKEVRMFGTVTREVLALADWMTSQQVTHVAMESTGVYWKPLYNLLEGQFSLLLVNAHHIKAVRGRKTDVKDCEWIGDLLRHGLLKNSFVPERPQRELRELTRYRTSLVQEGSAEVNRLQKTLEGANIKLASVASDTMGRSGREMLEALVAGVTDPAVLADLARGQLRGKIPQLQEALVGSFGPHQRFLVARQLAHIDYLETVIEELSKEIAERMRPFEDALERLDEIPGIARTTAEVLIAEVGTDMSRFPSADHLASWAGMCPGNYESAGKRKGGKTRKANSWLRGALTQAGHAAGRKKGSYYAAQYSHLSERRGSKRAAIAVGHSILDAVFAILKDPTVRFRDLGAQHFERRDREQFEKRLIQQLEALGNTVSLQRVPVPA